MHNDRADQQREHLELCGLVDPAVTELEQAHDEQLDAQDRTQRLADLDGIHVEQPSDRERREHYDETRVRNQLHPRTGNVQVQPARLCDCGARDLGYPHPGHRYACRNYAKRPIRNAA